MGSSRRFRYEVHFFQNCRGLLDPIAIKFINELNDLLIAKNITLTLNNSALDQLVTEGFDEKMGARPMKRLIADKIKKPLSKRIVFENLSNCELIVSHNGIDYELVNS